MTRTAFLSALLLLLLSIGCTKKEETPVPTVELVGKWELVTFTADPSPIQGTNDYLAYLRQIFGTNCSEINFFYNFNNDNRFSETTESKCLSGNSTDELLTAKWTSTATQLTLTADDSTQQVYTMELHPATTGKYAYMNLTLKSGGTTYFLSLNKL
jgi:hypothetical protein